MTEYLDRCGHLDDNDLWRAFDEASFWSARFGALMLEHLPIGKGWRIVDLGCGSGFPLLEIAGTFGPSSRLVGVDLEIAALRRAERKRQAHVAEHVTFVGGDASNLPFPDRSFDLAVSNVGINNFADPRTAMMEIGRVVRPDGVVAMTTNVCGHMAEFYDVFRDLLRARGDELALERLRKNEEHRLDRSILLQLMDEAGFEEERVVERSFTMRYVDGSALLRHSLTVFGFLGGWTSVLGPADPKDVFTELEERLNARARDAGEFQASVPMLYLEGRRR